MSEILRIWYVASQRLCNFKCKYCVSVEDYAKSNTFDWLRPGDTDDFTQIVRWIGERPMQLGVRLASLGEPFASKPFLQQAAWLSRRENVRYVELVSNGSLLRTRLPQLRHEADFTKLSLWLTHHHTQISVHKFMEGARLARDEYECFVVLNGLLFPDNHDEVAELHSMATAENFRFNVDFGYDPLTPHGKVQNLKVMIPALASGDAERAAKGVGAVPELIDLNLAAMRNLQDKRCSAGHGYIYIGIHGDVYRCSRYQALDLHRMGNVLDPQFELELRKEPFAPCEAGFGCGNKEDFLNLRADSTSWTSPSLGWPWGEHVLDGTGE